MNGTKIIGHQEVLGMFDRLAQRESLAHAYLFVGPTGVGKATVARWVAKGLLCKRRRQVSCVSDQPSGDTVLCGTCDACMAVERGAHLDVHVLRPDGGTIAIDAVREWTIALSRTSLFAGWKIGIVEEAETLTEAAANACLKTIEEPTPRTLIILTTLSRRRVLPTIASRCALVVLQGVPRADIEAALCARNVTPDEARVLADAADGCPGVALTLLQDADYRQKTEAILQAARAAITGPNADRLRRIEMLLREQRGERAADNRSALQLIVAFRRLARERIRLTDSATPAFAQWMRLLVRAPDYLAANVSPRLLLETIVITAPTIETLIPKS